MRFWNTLGKIERIWFYGMLFLVGVLFAAAACVVLALPKGEYLSAEGTIQSIEYSSDSSDAESENVFVSYTDADGVFHENVRYPSYSSSMKEGKTVTVLYDPAAPEEIHAPGVEFLPYLFLGLGVVAMAAAIIQTVVGFRKTNSDSPFENAEKPVDPALAEQIRNDDSPVRDYYFHWTGKLNQSYILETPERKAVMEAICDHIGVFTPYRYTFANWNTGKKEEHKVSHTVTTRYGSGSENASFSVVSASGFKIDGVNNWEYLVGLGYSVEPKREGIKLNFDVLRGGVPVAFLEAAGVNILKDDKKSVLGEKLPGTGLFKVSCKDTDLEGVFAACFCVSRVEFY